MSQLGRILRPFLGSLLLVSGVLISSASPLAETSSNANAPSPQLVCESVHSGDVPPIRLERLSRGFNLSGWLDSETPRRPDSELLARLRRLGFTHIRLPVEAEALMPAFARAADASLRLAELEEAVGLLLKLDFGVIIDMHPGERFQTLHDTDPDGALEQLAAAWRQVATRFAGRDPDRVFFELLNEPAPPQLVWQPQAEALAAAIRAIAPDHTLIFGPAGFQTVSALAGSAPLSIRNVVYAVHFYQPMEFTHQGLDWGDEDSPLRSLRGVPYPLRNGDPRAEALVKQLVRASQTETAAQLKEAMAEGWDDDRIAAAFAPLARWALDHGKPIIVDEFGVLGRYANAKDRSRWLRAVRIEAERYCFGWTHWEFDQAFGFLNEAGTDADPHLAKALLGK